MSTSTEVVEVTRWHLGTRNLGWKNVPETDPCRMNLKFPEWFELACQVRDSGFEMMFFRVLKSLSAAAVTTPNKSIASLC